MIDNHNGMRMHPIALEETWLTSHWPNRVFSFLLAVTVVNVQNAATYFFNKEKIDALTAKHLIARDLIFNKHMKNVEEPRFSKQRRRRPIDHFLITLPKKKLSKMDDWWTAKTHIRGRHVVSAALNIADPTAPAPQG